jgi:hypothetical protein
MSEVAEILLIARDLTQAAFKSVGENLRGLQAAAAGANGGIGGLGNSLANALGYANLQTAAIAGAINTARAGISALNDTLSAGLDRQAEELNAITTATKTLGLGYNDAAKYVKNFYEQVSILGRDLPTSAENISVISRTIQDDFALGLKTVGKTANEIGDALLNASTKAALLGELSNTRIRDTRAALAAYVAGSIGPRGLNQYKFFADNTLLKSALVDNLKAINSSAKSFADVSLSDRINILIKSLESAISDDDIARLQKLSKSTLSSFTDRLFDPNVGIFSIQRDLNPNVEGYQSVLTSLNDTINLVIGDDGIFWELARILGITGDVMIPVRDRVESFNNWLKGVAESLKGLNTGDIEGLGQKAGMWASDFLFGIIGSISKGIIGNLPGLILFAGEFLLSFLISSLKNAAFLVVDLVSSIPKFVYDLFIAPVLGRLAAPAIAVVEGINALFVAPVLNTLVSGAKFIFNLIGSAVNAVKNLLRPIASATGLIDDSSVDGSAKSTTRGLGSAPGVTPLAPINGNLGVAKFLLGLLPKYAGNIPTAADGYFPAISKEMRNAPAGAKPVIANSSEFILNPQQMSNLVRGSKTSGSTVNFNSGSIVMNLPSGTPQEIAMAAIAIIENALTNELDVRLA